MRVSTALSFGVAFGCFVVAAGLSAATIDTTTHGNWIGVYGNEGYILTGYNAPGYTATASTALDAASLPSYVSSYSYGPGVQQYVWATGQSDPRAPQDPANPSGPRNATTAFNGTDYTVTLNLSQPQSFQLGVYGLDWDNFNGRDMTVTVNGDTVEFNNTTIPDAYHQGEWGLFNVTAPAGPLVLSFHQLAGSNSNSTISAITFSSPVPEPSSLLLLLCGGLGFAWHLRRKAKAA